MSVLSEQISKAERRAAGLDLRALAEASRARPPAELASRQALDDRASFLADTLGDRGRHTFERLIGGDELQPINYLPHGAVASRAICRLTINDITGRLQGYATGFLI